LLGSALNFSWSPSGRAHDWPVVQWCVADKWLIALWF